jgi:endonuclease I
MTLYKVNSISNRCFFVIIAKYYYTKVDALGLFINFISEILLHMRKLFTLFTFIAPLIAVIAQLPAYYQSIDFSQSESQVQQQLKTLITTTHSALQYSQTYTWVKYIDEDATNTNNVILIYNGQSISKLHTIGGGNDGSYPETWNREHVYPQSLIGTTAAADLHHLRACDAIINNNRGNLPFANGTGTHGTVAGGYYPGNEWKGDVARMIMYLYLRYDEPFEDVGTLALFLQWNVEDPVSDFERQRNNRIQEAQGNRNPFIDQPYLATFFWGGTPAEDTWGWPNQVEELTTNSTISCYPNPAKDFITIHSTLPYHSTCTVSIVNSTGQLIHQSTSIIENQIINLPLNHLSLPAGIYFIHLTDNSISYQTRFIVE